MKKISICIPVFNQDIRPLLQNLLQQIATYNQQNQKDKAQTFTIYHFQIIVLDDASTDAGTAKQNEAFCKTVLVDYYHNPINLGRSKTRNRFLTLTEADWLLFLDGDSLPVEPRFLQRYLDVLDAGLAMVVYGGTEYSHEPPDLQFLLHWKYGRHAEALPAGRRNEIPVMSFHSNNFLIAHITLAAIPFRENISGYGHEDSVLAIDLAHTGIEILHIENPVYHLGLSTNADFIDKTKQAIENLPIAANLFEPGVLEKYNRLWRTYRRYRRFFPLWIAFFCKYLFGRAVEKKLLRASYHPRIFSLYKLLYLMTLKRG